MFSTCYDNYSEIACLLILNLFSTVQMYDPSISVFKGYSLPKETEAYLNSHGLKNSICSIGASAVQADLFGTLVVCPFQVISFVSARLSLVDNPFLEPQMWSRCCVFKFL